MITFQNVEKRFKNNVVLKDISFEIKQGELVVLIGKSGCGKTTTLKMINELIHPSEGSILIQGEDIAKKDVIKLRRNMGYVIQQTGLFPHMTIEQNIELIPKLEKYDKDKIKARTLELLDMVGLDESYLKRYPSELSGGQQQRIGVARAFACNPDIILMDEPFSALDPITRASLQDELIDLQADLKKTIVFVTHDMDEAVKIADRICIMDKGEIVQYDTPENILKNPANEFVSGFVGSKRIWNSPEYIKAKDVMIKSVVSCTPKISVFRALEKMRSYKVDSLIVVEGRNDHVVGILYSKELSLVKDKSISVDNVMKLDYAFVHEEDTIIDILEVINQKGISSIPVVENETLIGLITKGSLITTLSQQYIEVEEGGE